MMLCQTLNSNSLFPNVHLNYKSYCVYAPFIGASDFLSATGWFTVGYCDGT